MGERGGGCNVLRLSGGLFSGCWDCLMQFFDWLFLGEKV